MSPPALLAFLQDGFSPLLSACLRASWIHLVNYYYKKKMNKASGFSFGDP